MGKHTKKQHYIPKFIIRRFTQENKKYLCYDKLKNEYSEIAFDSKDVFQIKCFYEYDGEISNQIENRFSKFENEFALILTKLENNVNTGTVVFNRRELNVLKLFLISLANRHAAIRERAKNLEGDKIYNLVNSKKSELTIKNEQLEFMNIILDVYEDMDNQCEIPKQKKFIEKVELLRARLMDISFEQIKLMESMGEQDIKRLVQYGELNMAHKLLPINVQTEVFELEQNPYNRIFDGITSSFIKIINIPSEISGNFLMTDTNGVIMFNEQDNSVLLEFFYLTRKIGIALICNDGNLPPIPGLDLTKRKHEISKKSIINRLILPNIIEYTHDVERTNKNIKIVNSRFAREPSNNDKLTYSVYNIDDPDQIDYINGMLLSQVSRYVSFYNINDLKNAEKASTKYNIIRREEYW